MPVFRFCIEKQNGRSCIKSATKRLTRPIVESISPSLDAGRGLFPHESRASKRCWTSRLERKDAWAAVLALVLGLIANASKVLSSRKRRWTLRVCVLDPEHCQSKVRASGPEADKVNLRV